MNREEANKHAANFTLPMQEFTAFLAKNALESRAEGLSNAEMLEGILDRWGGCVSEMKKAMRELLIAVAE